MSFNVRRDAGRLEFTCCYSSSGPTCGTLEHSSPLLLEAEAENKKKSPPTTLPNERLLPVRYPSIVFRAGVELQVHTGCLAPSATGRLLFSQTLSVPVCRCVLHIWQSISREQLTAVIMGNALAYSLFCPRCSPSIASFHGAFADRTGALSRFELKDVVLENSDCYLVK